MQHSQLFYWKDFDFDIHIGGSRSQSKYHYPDLRYRSEYQRKQYQKKKREKLNATAEQVS